MGVINVDVSEVAKNIEIMDSYPLTGIKTTAKVTARLKFTYMA